MSYIGQTLPADTFQGFTTDSFAGDGSATTFTLSKEPFSEDTLIVVINNVIQKPTTNFTVSGTTLTIVGTAVASGDVIYAIHMGGPLPIGEANKLDLNGASDQLILDADGDTTISADTDDQIDIKIAGADDFQFTANTFTVASGSTLVNSGNAIQSNAGITIDDITIDGTEIDLSSGDLTVDVAGDILLDAGGSDIRLRDSGTQFGILNGTSSNFTISSTVSDKDVIIQGNDGGSTITALTLDMSDAGAATLNNGLTLTDGNLVVASGHGIDFGATGDNSHTMTTELLDDYEEGTYAYTITGSNSGSLNLRSGYARGVYTKIGNWVHVNTRFETSSDNSIDGNIKWSLPFTMADPNGSDADAAVAPGYIRDNSMSTDARTGFYLLSQSQAFVQLIFSRESDHNSTVELATHSNTDGVLEGTISISYRTT